MKKIWSLEKLNGNNIYEPVKVSANYFRFSSDSKKYLKEEDDKAVFSLKEELGEIEYSDEAKTKFKEVHNSIKNLFRVVEGEVADDCKKEEYNKYSFVKENQGVFSYLWNTRRGTSKSDK